MDTRTVLILIVIAVTFSLFRWVLGQVANRPARPTDAYGAVAKPAKVPCNWCQGQGE